jgi:hypothetical protein
MRGRNNALAIESLNTFQVRNDGASKVFEAMYGSSSDKVLNGIGRETFDAIKLLQSIEKQPYQPAAEYPAGAFGQSLRQIARLIKADVGVEVAFAISAAGTTTLMRSARSLHKGSSGSASASSVAASPHSGRISGTAWRTSLS